MRNTTWIPYGVALMLAVVPAGADETAASRLERGVELMQDEAKLKEAIRQFEGVLRAESQSRKLAAEAHFHLAKCYLAMDEPERAAAQLEMLREGWPAENPWVIRAASLMPEPSIFGPASWESGEFLTYDIVTPGGQNVGRMHSAVVASEEDGADTWTGWTFRRSDGVMLSRIEFLAENYRPVKGRLSSPAMGEVVLTMDEDGAWRTERPDGGEALQQGEATDGGWEAAPIYDNDEVMHLMRTLPKAIGSKVTIPITTALLGGGRIDFELEAKRHDTIEVPAGRFDCVFYESNINQNFWIELAGRKRIVKIEAGMVEIDLVEIDEDWEPTQPTALESEALGVSLELPAGILETPVADNKEVYRFGMVDRRFRIREGMVEIQPTSNFNEDLRGSEEVLMDFLVEGFIKKLDEGEEIEGARKTVELEGREALAIQGHANNR